jgi:hypothetical protein
MVMRTMNRTGRSARAPLAKAPSLEAGLPRLDAYLAIRQQRRRAALVPRGRRHQRPCCDDWRALRENGKHARAAEVCGWMPVCAGARESWTGRPGTGRRRETYVNHSVARQSTIRSSTLSEMMVQRGVVSD